MLDRIWFIHCQFNAELKLSGAQRVTVGSEGSARGDRDDVINVDFRASSRPDLIDITIQLAKKDHAEAWEAAQWWSDEVAATLSFLISRRVSMTKLEVTDAPPVVVAGKDYELLIKPDKAATISPPTILPATDLAITVKARPERVSRAMRWLHRARNAREPIDEFICLVVALESVSHLLGSGGMAYWQCAYCKQEYKACPACGSTTGRKTSGSEMLREFVVQQLAWEETDWRAVWRLRNALLHGEGDISHEVSRVEFPPLLPRLEKAAVSAIKVVAGLSPEHSPTTLAPRPLFADSYLAISYRPSN